MKNFYQIPIGAKLNGFTKKRAIYIKDVIKNNDGFSVGNRKK
jgi:hypothetical protein